MDSPCISLLAPVDPLSIESQWRDGSLCGYDKGKRNDKSPKRLARAVKHKEAKPAAGFLFEIACSSRSQESIFRVRRPAGGDCRTRERGGVKSKAKHTKP